MKKRKIGFYEKYIKRLIDIICSGGALIVLSPVLLFVATIVRIKLGSPVIFNQKRPGKDGKIFHIYKFRSMSDARNEHGEFLPDEVRLTKFGRKLRATSLDELPELINILKGDMSIIGPRPLAVQYLPYYTEEEMHRHDVRPGLTGLAQAKDRNITTWEKRFAYDLEYVNNISFLGDVRIILLTVKIVLNSKNVGERGVDAPPDFDTYRKSQIEKERVGL